MEDESRLFADAAQDNVMAVLVSSSQQTRELNFSNTRVREFHTEPELNHIELLEMHAGYDCREHIFARDSRIYELLRNLGFSATQDYQSDPVRDEEARGQYRNPRNETAAADYDLLDAGSSYSLIASPPPDNSGEDFDIPREEPKSVTVEYDEDTSLTFDQSATVLVIFEEYPEMDYIQVRDSQESRTGLFFGVPGVMDILTEQGFDIMMKQYPPKDIVHAYTQWQTENLSRDFPDLPEDQQ